MTTVEILFRYAAPPTDAVTSAVASTREVYGIRRLKFDRAARTLCVEYDATRLNAADVASLVLQAGLQLVPSPLEELPQAPDAAVSPQAPAA